MIYMYLYTFTKGSASKNNTLLEILNRCYRTTTTVAKNTATNMKLFHTFI